jgi:hypothetical protein
MPKDHPCSQNAMHSLDYGKTASFIKRAIFTHYLFVNRSHKSCQPGATFKEIVQLNNQTKFQIKDTLFKK